MMLIEWILMIGFLGVCFLLVIVLASLSRIGRAINVLNQVVAIGIQRAGLVRTPEEVREDALAAELEEVEIPEE